MTGATGKIHTSPYAPIIDPTRATRTDPVFRMIFARLVTHYWRHAAWLEDGILQRNIGKLGDIPGVLVHGRLDVSSPLDVPWALARRWPSSALIVVDEAGHSSGEPGMSETLVAATDRFAQRQ